MATAPIPSISAILPELAAFVEEQSAALGNGDISAEDDFAELCDAFYTDARMEAIDSIVPGWVAMASHANGKTLRHTTAALVATLDFDEYRRADPHDRRLMGWIVLLHDIAKEPTAETRDHRHAFRSAAAAGAILPALGFPVAEAWDAGFDDWFRLTDSAHRFDSEAEAAVQDNGRLPEIVGGIDRLFGRDAALIVKAILLHLSVTVVADWPAPAPLSPAEERAFIGADLRPLLLVMMMADHGGWNLFDQETLADMCRETREVFARLAAG